MTDVSDLTDQELAAVVGLCGVRTVAQATGLSVGFLLALQPAAGEAHPRYRNACPGCGTPRDPRRDGPCISCRRDRVAERVDRARTLLAAGLSAHLACEALAEREGISPLTARRAVAIARREPVAA